METTTDSTNNKAKNLSSWTLRFLGSNERQSVSNVPPIVEERSDWILNSFARGADSGGVFHEDDKEDDNDDQAVDQKQLYYKQLISRLENELKQSNDRNEALSNELHKTKLASKSVKVDASTQTQTNDPVDQASPLFLPGITLKVIGLVKQNHLNGAEVKVLEYIAEENRYKVILEDGSCAKFRPQNLELSKVISSNKDSSVGLLEAACQIDPVEENDEDEDNGMIDEQRQVIFSNGTMVEIFGLSSNKELNNSVVEVFCFVENQNRYKVKFQTGGFGMLKPSHLRLVGMHKNEKKRSSPLKSQKGEQEVESSQTAMDSNKKIRSSQSIASSSPAAQTVSNHADAGMDEVSLFEVGSRARVVGLTKANQMNGSIVTIVEFHKEEERYEVFFEDESIGMLKPINLCAIKDTPAPVAHEIVSVPKASPPPPPPPRPLPPSKPPVLMSQSTLVQKDDVRSASNQDPSFRVSTSYSNEEYVQAVEDLLAYCSSNNRRCDMFIYENKTIYFAETLGVVYLGKAALAYMTKEQQKAVDIISHTSIDFRSQPDYPHSKVADLMKSLRSEPSNENCTNRLNDFELMNLLVDGAEYNAREIESYKQNLALVEGYFQNRGDVEYIHSKYFVCDMGTSFFHLLKNSPELKKVYDEEIEAMSSELQVAFQAVHEISMKYHTSQYQSLASEEQEDKMVESNQDSSTEQVGTPLPSTPPSPAHWAVEHEKMRVSMKYDNAVYCQCLSAFLGFCWKTKRKPEMFVFANNTVYLKEVSSSFSSKEKRLMNQEQKQALEVISAVSFDFHNQPRYAHSIVCEAVDSLKKDTYDCAWTTTLFKFALLNVLVEEDTQFSDGDSVIELYRAHVSLLSNFLNGIAYNKGGGLFIEDLGTSFFQINFKSMSNYSKELELEDLKQVRMFPNMGLPFQRAYSHVQNISLRYHRLMRKARQIMSTKTTSQSIATLDPPPKEKEQMSSSAAAEDDSKKDMSFISGTNVKVVGLSQASYMNGSIVTIVDFDKELERYKVQFENKSFGMFKASNLQKLGLPNGCIFQMQPNKTAHEIEKPIVDLPATKTLPSSSAPSSSSSLVHLVLPSLNPPPAHWAIEHEKMRVSMKYDNVVYSQCLSTFLDYCLKQNRRSEMFVFANNTVYLKEVSGSFSIDDVLGMNQKQKDAVEVISAVSFDFHNQPKYAHSIVSETISILKKSIDCKWLKQMDKYELLNVLVVENAMYHDYNGDDVIEVYKDKVKLLSDYMKSINYGNSAGFFLEDLGTEFIQLKYESISSSHSVKHVDYTLSDLKERSNFSRMGFAFKAAYSYVQNISVKYHNMKKKIRESMMTNSVIIRQQKVEQEVESSQTAMNSDKKIRSSQSIASSSPAAQSVSNHIDAGIDEASLFEVGSRARVVGLTKANQMNGSIVTIVEFDKDQERYKVLFENNSLGLLKANNLCAIEDAPTPVAHEIVSVPKASPPPPPPLLPSKPPVLMSRSTLVQKDDDEEEEQVREDEEVAEEYEEEQEQLREDEDEEEDDEDDDEEEEDRSASRVSANHSNEEYTRAVEDLLAYCSSNNRRCDMFIYENKTIYFTETFGKFSKTVLAYMTKEQQKAVDIISHTSIDFRSQPDYPHSKVADLMKSLRSEPSNENCTNRLNDFELMNLLVDGAEYNAREIESYKQNLALVEGYFQNRGDVEYIHSKYFVCDLGTSFFHLLKNSPELKKVYDEEIEAMSSELQVAFQAVHEISMKYHTSQYQSLASEEQEDKMVGSNQDSQQSVTTETDMPQREEEGSSTPSASVPTSPPLPSPLHQPVPASTPSASIYAPPPLPPPLYQPMSESTSSASVYARPSLPPPLYQPVSASTQSASVYARPPLKPPLYQPKPASTQSVSVYAPPSLPPSLYQPVPVSTPSASVYTPPPLPPPLYQPMSASTSYYPPFQHDSQSSQQSYGNQTYSHDVVSNQDQNRNQGYAYGHHKRQAPGPYSYHSDKRQR